MTSHQKVKYVLGVETSCDDTAIGIIDSSKNIIANIVLNQNNYHMEFGGIVPEIAARAHLSCIDIALKKALTKAKIKLEEIDLFCSTGGPGLIGGLIVGNTFCKTLAWSLKKPFLAINHLEGHALTARLLYDLNYPFLLLLVSGGHTQLIAVLNYGEYIRISTTLDDSAGETFDKAAKMMGLGQPGGPLIEKLSKEGNEHIFKFPRPLYKSKNPNFSFSGLKTAFSKTLNNLDINDNKHNLAASLQKTISDCLLDRTKLAIKIFKHIIKSNKVNLVIAGGVAANKKIRADLKYLSNKEDIKFYVPTIELCTDNGPMIAWAGFERYKHKKDTMFNFKPRPRWPLDPIAYKHNPTMRLIGKKGIKA